MRVLHLLCDLSGGGAERLVLAIAARNGHEVAVLHDGGSLSAPVHRLHRVRGRPGARALGRLTRLSRSFDALHVHLGAGVLWGVPAARAARRPVVVSWHGTEAESAFRARARQFWMRRADRVLAVSRSVAEALHAEGVASTVVPNGVALDQFAAPWVGGAGVLAVGRLAPEKGFDLLGDLGLPGVPITLVGPPGSAPAPAGVTWAGEVDDVAARMALADVVVIPSRREGASLVAMEAMAAGAPVIATQVGGLPEVLGDVARWIPPDSPAALRDALAAVLGDPTLRQAMSAAGRARSRQFDLNATAAAWSAACEEVVRRPHPVP